MDSRAAAGDLVTNDIGNSRDLKTTLNNADKFLQNAHNESINQVKENDKPIKEENVQSIKLPKRILKRAKRKQQKSQ